MKYLVVAALVAVLGIAAYAAPPVSDGLVARYNADDIVGASTTTVTPNTWVDATGRGNNLVSGPWAPGAAWDFVPNAINGHAVWKKDAAWKDFVSGQLIYDEFSSTYTQDVLNLEDLNTFDVTVFLVAANWLEGDLTSVSYTTNDSAVAWQNTAAFGAAGGTDAPIKTIRCPYDGIDGDLYSMESVDNAAFTRRILNRSAFIYDGWVGKNPGDISNFVNGYTANSPSYIIYGNPGGPMTQTFARTISFGGNSWENFGRFDLAEAIFFNRKLVAEENVAMRTYLSEKCAIDIIPEPGSMLALGTGLVGLAGFVIRKRK